MSRFWVLGSAHLALCGSDHPAAQEEGQDRGDPAGTGPPRRTGWTRRAAPGLKTNKVHTG